MSQIIITLIVTAVAMTAAYFAQGRPAIFARKQSGLSPKRNADQ